MKKKNNYFISLNSELLTTRLSNYHHRDGTATSHPYLPAAVSASILRESKPELSPSCRLRRLQQHYAKRISILMSPNIAYVHAEATKKLNILKFIEMKHLLLEGE